MSWKDKAGEPDPPRGYHHGNLREALIRAALELIATRGRPDSLSPKQPALPGSARRRPIGISATAMN